MSEQLQQQWRDILLELLLSIGHELSLEKQFKQFLPVLLRKLACKGVAVFEIDPIFYQDYVLVKELPRNSGLADYAEKLAALGPVSGEQIESVESGKVYAYTLSGYGFLLIKHNELPNILLLELRQLCEHFSHRLRACLQHHKLQQSQQELDRFFELSDNLMCILNAKGNFIKVNPAFLEKLNFTLDDFYTMPFSSFIHPEDLDSTEQALQHLVAEQSHTFKNRFRRASGEYLDLAWDLACDPTTGNIYATAMDISQQVATEEKLMQAKETAEQTAAAKAAFLANMSHEIRTPLNGVLGMLDVVLQQSLDDTVQKQLQTVYQSGQSLLAIVNDVLDFSRINAGKLQLEATPFHLPSLFKHLHDSFAYRASSQQLQFSIEQSYADTEWFLGDPLRIQQILTNLVSNAFKFTHHGSVTLSVQVKSLSQGQQLHFIVADTGIGMDNAAQAMIFDAFAQADSSTTRYFGGTGLGLSICMSLAELMQAELTVDSRLGVGSSFHFKVLLPASAPADDTEAHKQLPAAQCRATVLLVEDNEINLQIAQATLNTLGCSVSVATNGVEAIQALQQASSGAYDLVIMDCLMPKMDGYEATRLIRQGQAGACWQHVPILALTANAMAEDRARCLSAGMTDHLAKPFTRIDLSERLQKWLPHLCYSDEKSVSPGQSESLVDQAQSTTENECWNKASFEKSFQGMESLGQELLTLFKSHLGDTFSQLNDALASGDFTALRRLAHSLKSSAAQLHFMPLSEQAKLLEQLAISEQKAPIEAALPTLLTEIQRCLNT